MASRRPEAASDTRTHAETDPVPDRVAVVVTTYRRPVLLDRLLASIHDLATGPWRVYVVDNASGDETGEVLASWQPRFGDRLVVLAMDDNTGGAGGFHHGMARAYADGAAWMWLMDDDVEVLPGALERLAPWMQRFACLNGRNLDHDGTPFRWQARFVERLGIAVPLRGDPFGPQGWFEQSVGYFEGMMVRRDVVARIGLPDPRFFIVLDDAVYGWLAHRVTTAAVVDTFVLRRTREIADARVGGLAVKSVSALYLFHVMRNRALLAAYLREHGELRPVGFALGTAITFGKETVRVVLHARGGSPRAAVSDLAALVRGARAARSLRREPWAPMPPLPESA